MTNPRDLMDSQVRSLRIYGQQLEMTSQRSNLSSLRFFFPKSSDFRLAHEAIYKSYTCANDRSSIEKKTLGPQRSFDSCLSETKSTK